MRSKLQRVVRSVLQSDVTRKWLPSAPLILVAALAAFELLLAPGALYRLLTPSAAYALSSTGTPGERVSLFDRRHVDPDAATITLEHLGADELRTLSVRFYNLEVNLDRLQREMGQCNMALEDIGRARDAVWEQHVRSGLGDKALASDYYLMADSRPFAPVEALTEVGTGMFLLVAEEWIDAAKLRLLGGVITDHDRMFVARAESIVAVGLTHTARTLPAVTDMQERIGAELPEKYGRWAKTEGAPAR